MSMQCASLSSEEKFEMQISLFFVLMNVWTGRRLAGGVFLWVLLVFFRHCKLSSLPKGEGESFNLFLKH